MKKRVLLFSSLAAAGLVLSACNDYVGKEKSHPLYVKAAKEKSAGEYKEAARCYEEFLLICPKSSRTHHAILFIWLMSSVSEEQRIPRRIPGTP